MTNSIHPCEEHCGTKGDLAPGEVAPGVLMDGLKEVPAVPKAVKEAEHKSSKK